MISDDEPWHVQPRHSDDSTDVAPTIDGLLLLLRRHVSARFDHFSELRILAVPLPQPTLLSAEAPPANPAHPLCAPFAETDYCRESWQLHLATLTADPAAHWHRCEHCLLCALVPVALNGRCLAAVKLVGPGSMPEDEFEKHLDLLNILVRDFVTTHAQFLSRFARDGQEPTAAASLSETAPTCTTLQPSHPKVREALRFIDDHLADSALTVNGVARHIDLHPCYLGHLFTTQVGERMNRYIARRRIELARRLLTTTTRQIKRIAVECGFANPNWFCHVFVEHTGTTPGEYRRANLNPLAANHEAEE